MERCTLNFCNNLRHSQEESGRRNVDIIPKYEEVVTNNSLPEALRR